MNHLTIHDPAHVLIANITDSNMRVDNGTCSQVIDTNNYKTINMIKILVYVIGEIDLSKFDFWDCEFGISDKEDIEYFIDRIYPRTSGRVKIITSLLVCLDRCGMLPRVEIKFLYPWQDPDYEFDEIEVNHIVIHYPTSLGSAREITGKIRINEFCRISSSHAFSVFTNVSRCKHLQIDIVRNRNTLDKVLRNGNIESLALGEVIKPQLITNCDNYTLRKFEKLSCNRSYIPLEFLLMVDRNQKFFEQSRFARTKVAAPQ